MADQPQPPPAPADRLVVWALATFHAAALLAALTLLLHLSGKLTSLLGGLNTLTGLALFGALWLTTYWSTDRALMGAFGDGLQPTLSLGQLIGRILWRGGVNGVAFLPLLGVILAIPILFSAPAAAVPFVLAASVTFLTVGVAVAFVIGCVVGLFFAAIDLALVEMARALLK